MDNYEVINSFINADGERANVSLYKTNINGQWNVYLPKHRHEREQWTSEAGWEREKLNSIFNTVKEGDVLFEIGGEEMDETALFSQWKCDIVVFEPNLKVWANGKNIWLANNLKNPLACFVGFAGNDTHFDEADICYNRFPDCANGEVISDHGFKNLWEEGTTMPQIKIDDFVELTGIIPKHLSIDVEGGENNVLHGAEQTLREYKPNIWLSLHPEFLIKFYNIYSYELRRWIIDLGYKETILAYQHELHTLYEPI